MMKVKKNAKYAVACLSSMGLRITPENRMAVHNSNRFLLQATSASTPFSMHRITTICPTRNRDNTKRI